MTNYEKLISSIILSAVLSKTTYGLGCGCNCFDDDDDDTIESYKSPKEIKNENKNKNNYYESKINIKTPKTTNNYSFNKLNEEIIFNNYDIDEENNTSSLFYKNYGEVISTIIKTREKNNLLQLFIIESQIFNKINNENEGNISEEKEDIEIQNIKMIKELYKIFQEEYKNKVDRNFSYDFYEGNKDQIENFDYITQLTIVSFLINLINAISEENQTIEKFSETCLYHNLKEKHNKDSLKEFIIQKKSPNIFQKLRDQLFLSLFNYTTSYLNLCYLKFGEGFWIKKEEKTISLSNFFKKESDKKKTIKELFAYKLYKNVCDMPFSKITNIKEKINSLPNFSDVFEKNKKTYKIKEEQIENFKGYFNFLEENNSNPLEHEKDINKFFAVLPKLDKVNEIQDEEFGNMSFAFKGLEAPEIKLTENIKEEEEE